MTARLDWRRLLVAASLLIIALLIFSRAMDRGFNHDEHQFLLPGALLSRAGLLPYRDYPLFHFPNLVFVYAFLDRISSDLLGAARAFNAGCATVIAGIALLVALGRKSDADPFSKRFGLALALGLLVLLDPLFIYTTGKTWNHELPTALIIGAMLLVVRNTGTLPAPAVFLSGVLAGSAVATRLTFAPLLCPLFLAAIFGSGPAWRTRIRAGLVWSLGVFLSLLPTLWVCLQAPDAFVFDNFKFPRLLLADPSNTRIHKTITFWRKLRYLGKEILLPSWPLVGLYFLIGIPAAICGLKRSIQERKLNSVAAAVLLSLPFALAGCFAPSRYQYQHYFAINCLLALGIASALRLERSRYATLATAAAALLTLAISLYTGVIRPNPRSRTQGIAEYRAVTKLCARENWFPSVVQRAASDLTSSQCSGPVLTLAPAWLLPTSLAIYPEFATGPFAWRSAAFVPEQKRRTLKFIAPADLPALFEARPPGAALTGLEDEALEEPIIEALEAAGYQPRPLPKGRTLWLRAAVSP